MRLVGEEEVKAVLQPEVLIPGLKTAFRSPGTVPQRQHLNLDNHNGKPPTTLLMMPAWESGGYLGIKMVTVAPANTELDIPSVQGVYYLAKAVTGEPLGIMDARALTTCRTAAASALASSYLSREEASTLLMVGTGALAPQLIRFHAAVRPITKVLIWGRDFQKAEQLARSLEVELTAMAVGDLKKAVQQADIISSATTSPEPLIQGKWLQAGHHVDLVGSYRLDTREADSETMKRSHLFVDTPAALFESGDLAIPLEEKAIKEEDILANLSDLVSGRYPGRMTNDEITVFKSVGHALEDLAGAKLIADKLGL